MFDRDTLDELQGRLEAARESLTAGTLRDEEVWALMVEVNARRREAAGGVYEGTMDVIADLVESLWNVTRSRSAAIRRLNELRAE